MLALGRSRAPQLVLVLALSACSSTLSPPDLGGIYDRAASDHTGQRNPVILIPGILGSNLIERSTGRVVWGAFKGNYARPGDPEDLRLIAHPMLSGVSRNDQLQLLRDDVVQNGALDTIKLSFLGLPLGVRAYVNILGALGVGGFRDQQLGLAGVIDYGSDHFTCFQFAYDWRRDLSETARELHEFIVEREAYVRAEYEKRGLPTDELKFDIVAHSMGGLVLRYYLRYGPALLPEDGSLPELNWAGTQYVDRAVLVGTPNAGAIGAFHELVEGVDFGPFLPNYPGPLLSTMPAVYQLLPRTRHGAWKDIEDDPRDVETWKRMGWGLLDPRQEETLAKLLPLATPSQRQVIAYAHTQKCLERAEQFQRALDIPAKPPSGVELILAAGDAKDTPARAYIGDQGRIAGFDWEPGDGVVLRSSALMDERLDGAWQARLRSPIHWSQVMFYFEDHLGLTQAPAFIDNLLFLLLEAPGF